VQKSLLLLFPILWSSAAASQEDLKTCESVLKVPAAVQAASYDYENQASSYFYQLCSQHFTQYSDAQAFAGKAGLSIPVMDELFNFSAQAKTSASNFQEEYNNQCNTEDARSAREQTIISQKKKYDPYIYQAWLSCVQEIARGRSTFAYVQPESDDGTEWLINFHFQVATTNPIKFAAILPTNLTCVLGDGSPVTPDKEETSTEFPLQCTKKGSQSLRATFQTNAGTIENVVLPGVQPIQDWERLIDTEIRPFLIPQNAILAFEKKCPATWREVDAADGRYLRVLDNTLPPQGGVASITLSQQNIPILPLSNPTNGNPSLWGTVQPGVAKQYSFSTANGGVGATSQYPVNNFSVGSPTPTPVSIEPSYFGVVLCEKD
jgi:hypothetical protein